MQLTDAAAEMKLTCDQSAYMADSRPVRIDLHPCTPTGSPKESEESEGARKWQDCDSTQDEYISTSESDGRIGSQSATEDSDSVESESDEDASVESDDEAEVDAKYGCDEGALSPNDTAADASTPLVKARINRKNPLLMQAMAVVLAQLVQIRKPTHCTLFDSKTVPSVGIHTYLARFQKYFKCSDACFVMGLIYLDRVLNAHPTFVVSGQNVHRLILTSLVVAAKFHEDSYYSNDYYARVGGIQTKELNHLEAKFLHMLDWRLIVQDEKYEEYSSSVLRTVSA